MVDDGRPAADPATLFERLTGRRAPEALAVAAARSGLDRVSGEIARLRTENAQLRQRTAELLEKLEEVKQQPDK